MPLTLVTGPANAEKAGHVLAAYRAALDRDPLLVVPTAADVERYRRELAAAGAVFGVQVLRFAWLEREMARRAEVAGRPLGALARERVAAAAVARAGLRRLAGSAATPGFLRAFLALVDELEERRIAPGRWYAALRAWAADAPGQADYAEELAALYGAYRDALDRLRPPGAGLDPGAPPDARPGPPGRRGAGTPRCARGPRTRRGRPTTPRSSPPCTAPIATRSTGSDAATRGCTRSPRSTRYGSTRPAGAARRSSSTASTTSPPCSATPSRRSRSTAAPTSRCRSPTSRGARRSPGAGRRSRS